MKPLKIVADSNMPGVEAIFSAYGEVERVEGRGLAAARLHDADVLLVRSVTTVDRALLAGSAVRFVGTATSGLEHIDQHYLAQRGIHFAHAQGSNANSVVEYVLAAIAACDDYLERLLAGASLGIVGHGHVGRRLAACARGLGIAVRVCDPWLEPFAGSAPLDEVLACEAISLHPELTSAQPWPSYHLVDDGVLARLGADKLLINASRGAVLDNAALLRRLQTGAGPRCVLDVWEGEPRIDTALLPALAFATPHIAGYSLDAKLIASRMLARALAAALGLPAPAVDAGAPPAEPLKLPPSGHAAAGLRALLQARYSIAADDRALRAALAEAPDADAVAGAFDALRRNYPRRRELRGSVVEAPGLPQHFLTALGLEYQAGSTSEGSAGA